MVVGRGGGDTSRRNKNMFSPDLFMDGVYTSGPSMPAHARLINQLEKVNTEKEELQRRPAFYEGQEVEPQGDSVVPDIEALREAVRKLTPHDEIVQLNFDEIFANRTDTLIGCHYVDERKKDARLRRKKPGDSFSHDRKRSPLHTFKFIGKNHINPTKQIGLDVRAAVCGNNVTYTEAVHKLPAGIVLLYDHLHLLRRYEEKIEKMKDKYD
uniref:Uncharacterized protein n=1 Tax=Glossina palpalis gambiensis TaxID=67801 RepID=A0A1B0BYQ5_9MUSC